MTLRIITVLALISTGCNSHSQKPDPQPASPPQIPIRILAWNVESGGNDPDTIGQQLRQFKDYDVFALSEVSPNSFKIYQSAVGQSFHSVESESGRGDRLQILYNSDRFELVSTQELTEAGGFRLNDGNHRSPLLAHLRDRESGQAFQLTVNHLARRNADLREEQAAGLREWARNESTACVAIGDFNFDYSFETQQGNSGFVAMLRDNVWHWAKPVDFIDTNWSDRGDDGEDDYPNSMLDFAFVAGPAINWSPSCRIVVRPGDFPDDEKTSDHRPTELILTP